MINKPTATISEIIFSGGNNINFSKNEKVILVGPNNSGKSQSLREILHICSSGSSDRTLVVKDLSVNKSGSAGDLKAYLEKNAEYVMPNYRYGNWQIHESHTKYWDRPFLTSNLAGGFIKNIDANNRLNICNKKNSIAPNEQKTTPQHILYNDDVLMQRISSLFRKAFGKDLMFDFRGGSVLPIHVGEAPNLCKLVDRAGDTYTNAVRENPLLDEQGDGMKSYAGILFEAIASNLDITLIDEPEAFLHPPQMRRLGETLASEVEGQLIVSTHSSDILRGFLEKTRGNIKILRIYREGDINIVSEADQNTIKDLWEKPNLKYSNALEGIFHEQTIICEDDSDCKLINSIADYLESKSDNQWKDTAYVPTGGKHGAPKVAKILRKTGVPVKAVFDIDFLIEKSLVKSTVEAFGGDWNKIGKLWTLVDKDVRGGIAPASIEDIKSNIISLLTASSKDQLPRQEVIEAMKQNRPWSEVKKYGKSGIPNGDAQKHYEQLNDSLESLGIYLVPVGEIENFCPDIGGHGPKFVSSLLSEVSPSDERLAELRGFVEKIHTQQTTSD